MKKSIVRGLIALAVCVVVLVWAWSQVAAAGDDLQYLVTAPQITVTTPTTQQDSQTDPNADSAQDGQTQKTTPPNQAVQQLYESFQATAADWNGIMLSIPDSLSEAAKIDGCGWFRTYATIIIPLTKTGLVTLAVLTFNTVWNDYMGPMIYLDSDKLFTIQIGLASFRQQYSADYGAIMVDFVLFHEEDRKSVV